LSWLNQRRGCAFSIFGGERHHQMALMQVSFWTKPARRFGFDNPAGLAAGYSEDPGRNCSTGHDWEP
jgi:hypothetical protein